MRTVKQNTALGFVWGVDFAEKNSIPELDNLTCVKLLYFV